MDDVPIFLEFDAFKLFEMIFGFIISLYFLYIEVGISISVFALIILIIIPITTYSYQSEIAANNNKYKMLNDERMNCICSRNPKVYTDFIQKVLKINIKNSDIQVKTFLLTYILQTILLFVSIFAVINSKNFTSGLLI